MRALSLLAVLSIACGGSVASSEFDPGHFQDPGTKAPAPSNPNANPQGVPYPTTNLGYVENTRIPNLKFTGFRAADTSAVIDTKGDTTVLSMSDYYDPLGNRGIRLVHLSVNTRWCGPSNEQVSWFSGFDYQTNRRTDPGLAVTLAPEGVLFLDVLAAGFSPGTPATLDDLRGWVGDHQINFDTAVDAYIELGSLFPQAAIPFNVTIDARSMAILETSMGFDRTVEDSLRKWLKWQSTNPPMPN